MCQELRDGEHVYKIMIGDYELYIVTSIPSFKVKPTIEAQLLSALTVSERAVMGIEPFKSAMQRVMAKIGEARAL